MELSSLITEYEETVNIMFKVVRQCNKTQFDTYTYKNAQVFVSVSELREFLFENFKTKLAPAASAESFRLRYLAGSNRRITISSSTQLAEAYSLEKKGWITLWADVDVKTTKIPCTGRKRAHALTTDFNDGSEDGMSLYTSINFSP